MFSDHDKISPSIAAVSALSAACSILVVQQQKRFCRRFVDVSAAIAAWAKAEGAQREGGSCPLCPAPQLPPLFRNEGALLPCRPTGITFCACDHITQLVKFLVKMATRTAEYDPSFVSTVSLHNEESDIASYFVDISLMFASQIQLNVINFCKFLCANGKSKLV